jgi:hypothetical protein
MVASLTVPGVHATPAMATARGSPMWHFVRRQAAKQMEKREKKKKKEEEQNSAE